MVESLPIYSPVYDVMNTISNKVFSLSQVDSGFTTVSLEKIGSTFITKFRYVLVRPSTSKYTHRSTHRSRLFIFYRQTSGDQYESYQSKLSAWSRNHISYILLFRSDICMITYDESTIISSTLELGEVLNLSNAPITWILKSRIVTESSTEWTPDLPGSRHSSVRLSDDFSVTYWLKMRDENESGMRENRPIFSI